MTRQAMALLATAGLALVTGCSDEPARGPDSGSSDDLTASVDAGPAPVPDTAPALDGSAASPDTAAAPGDGSTPPPADGATTQTDAAALPVPGAPYGFVGPQDVGQTIGVGVVAPAPTAVYSGPMKITAPTTIQNKVINGCLDIYSGGVTLRNVVLKCSGLYPLDVRGQGGKVINDVVVEYSRLECTSYSKLFMVGNVTNLKVQNNEMKGCEDFFFIGGNVDGMLVQDNYMHSSTLTSASHSDGFQIGEASTTTGTITLLGNQILANTPGGRNGIMFATNYSKAKVVMENNYFDDWGYYTLRCNATSFCVVRHNIFSDAAAHPTTMVKNGQIVCNRYESGSFIADGQNTGCPAYP